MPSIVRYCTVTLDVVVGARLTAKAAESVPETGRVTVTSPTLRPGTTVKLVALVPAPKAVVTESGPVVAPAGTTAMRLVGEIST